jgi:thiol-disulfide isomerase/thioredoxin
MTNDPNSQEWVDRKMALLDGEVSSGGATSTGLGCLRRRRREHHSRMIRLATIFAVLLVLLAFTASAPAAKVFASRCVDACLAVLQGTSTARALLMDDYRGRVVVVNFWATWCAPCREELPMLDDLHALYAKQGLVVLGVSMDEGDWDSVIAFGNKQKIRFGLVAGNEAIARQFGGVTSLPLTVVLDRQGKTIYRKAGLQRREDLEPTLQAALTASPLQ